jgi:hypothetical protein
LGGGKLLFQKIPWAKNKNDKYKRKSLLCTSKYLATLKLKSMQILKRKKLASSGERAKKGISDQNCT